LRQIGPELLGAEQATIFPVKLLGIDWRQRFPVSRAWPGRGRNRRGVVHVDAATCERIVTKLWDGRVTLCEARRRPAAYCLIALLCVAHGSIPFDCCG
jgi:hypothetical protein